MIEFEIIGLPKMTNGFRRQHWTHRYKEAKKWKALVYEQVSLCKSTPIAEPRLTLTRFSTREPDFDGLVSSFKHVIDGLVEAGAILDDKVSIIGQPTYLWEKAKPKQGKIKVRVEERAA